MFSLSFLKVCIGDTRPAEKKVQSEVMQQFTPLLCRFPHHAHADGRMTNSPMVRWYMILLLGSNYPLSEL